MLRKISPNRIGGRDKLSSIILEMGFSIYGGPPLAIGTYKIEGLNPLIFLLIFFNKRYAVL